MVSKLLYFVAIASLSHMALADTPFSNERENFVNKGIQSTAIIQPQYGEKSEISNIHHSENLGQYLKGSRSNLPKALFRQQLLMVTQPFEAFNIDEDEDPEDDALEGDTVAQEDSDESLVEGVNFRELLGTRGIFTELSGLPGNNIQLQTVG